MTASRSVATDYFHFTRSITKNDKTPYGHKVYGVDTTHNNSVSNPIKAKQLAFTNGFHLNGHSLLSVSFADATKRAKR